MTRAALIAGRQASIDWESRFQSLKLRVADFVDGRWQSAGGAQIVNKYSPRDGKLLLQFGTDTSALELAVLAARKSFDDGRWSKASVHHRKECLFKLASLIEKHGDELALLQCIDVGKPISEALSIDVPMAATIIRYNAEAADKCYGKVYAFDKANLSYQLRRPVGVVGAIVGWNFPLVLAAQKLGPALAAGNSLVLKPSELTPLSTAWVAELAIEAGVPPGVFNVIHGDSRNGAALAQHHEVDLISFTGSSQTGRNLLVAAGQSNMKRLILECGGKAPNIVFDDCPDFDSMAKAIVRRAFWNQGEVCTASSRLLIQESVKDILLPIVIREAAVLEPGDPLNAETKFGALISEKHRQKVCGYIERGGQEGARKVYHGRSAAPCEGGYYVSPVIFDKVSAQHRLAQEEIFGPVLSVMTFRDEAEAMSLANSTMYGLSAIIWTKDLPRAHRVSQCLNAGWVVINATADPTGGPVAGSIASGGHKQSGLGVEGGLEGLEAYTSNTAVQVFV